MASNLSNEYFWYFPSQLFWQLFIPQHVTTFMEEDEGWGGEYKPR